MKFVVSYGRKVKAGEPYEMLEIKLEQECDDAIEDFNHAYLRVREFVDYRIKEEQKRHAK